jgi:hypothetical protein
MIDKLVAVQKIATPHIVIHSYDLEYINIIIDVVRYTNLFYITLKSRTLAT